MRAARPVGATRTVAPLELFFDLVYVVAMGELTHHLAAHVDLRTGLETLVLALAVAYAWFVAAWGANWLDPDRLAVRLLLLAMSAASLLMTVSIGGAFGDRPWAFVAPYLALQVGRWAFLAVALRGTPMGGHSVHGLAWEVVAAVGWVSGAAAEAELRLALWGVAVAVTLAGVATLHWVPGRGRALGVGQGGIDAAHLVERFRLFFIIALGESVLLAAHAFGEEEPEAARVAALLVAFTGTAALWWCYFERVDPLAAREAEGAAEPGPVGMRGTWTISVLVLALLAVAVGDELTIADPGARPTGGFLVLAFGGPAAFLLAQATFLARSVGRVPWVRVGAVAVLALLAVPMALTARATALGCLVAATAVLVAVAVAETRARPRG